MKKASFIEICNYYELLKEGDSKIDLEFPGSISPQLLADLYLYYGDHDLDVLANREYFVSEEPSLDVVKSVLESEIFQRFNSKKELIIDYYSDPDILCDEGILSINESMCAIGLETLESCTGLHMDYLEGMDLREKYEYLTSKNNELVFYPYVTFSSPDEFSAIFFTKLLYKLQNTGGLFRISFDCGQIHLEMEELPKASCRWNSLLKAVYFWRCLEMLLKELLAESGLSLPD